MSSYCCSNIQSCTAVGDSAFNSLITTASDEPDESDDVDDDEVEDDDNGRWPRKIIERRFSNKGDRSLYLQKMEKETASCSQHKIRTSNNLTSVLSKETYPGR